jgi:predicted aspartyl protease
MSPTPVTTAVRRKRRKPMSDPGKAAPMRRLGGVRPSALEGLRRIGKRPKDPVLHEAQPHSAEPWTRVTRCLAARCIGAIAVLAGTLVLESSLPSPASGSSHLNLPSNAGGCQTSAPINGQAVSVPLAVSKSKNQVVALVSVCINGRGPFPLVLDSGATSSALDSQVVHTLGLPSAGKASKASGISCTTTSQPVKVTDWSIGSMALQGQTVGSSTIPNFGLHKAPAGLLGSDVLSRFGALRIDYQQQKLVLPGPEGPVPSGRHVVRGPSTTPTPADILTGYPTQTAVPLAVASIDDQVIALTPVQFSSPVNFTFMVDTGASGSAVSTEAASSLKLPTLKKRQHVSGAACQTSVALVRSGKWSMSGTPLLSETLTSVKLPTTSIDGLIGSDQLSRFGSVVIDYAGGRLLI